MNELQGDTLLIDMDDTIVFTDPACPDDVFMEALYSLIQEQRDVSREQAEQLRVEADVSGEHGDMHTALRYLKLDLHAYFSHVLRLIEPHTHPYDDAITMIREAKARGYRIFPATTNGRIACLAKLAVSGLADADDSPWFDDLFGGGEVAKGGKSGPHFHTALLERVDREHDQVVVIGDHPEQDLGWASEAGIEQVVLPRRDQKEDWVIEDGGIFVRDLTVILPWLNHHERYPGRVAPDTSG